MQVALQFMKARSVIYCMTSSFLICLENSIFIILVLLSDNHILAQCDVFISIGVGNAELFIHPPQNPPNDIFGYIYPVFGLM